MSDGYETCLDSILTNLLSTVKTGSFAVHAYRDYRRGIDYYPSLMLQLLRDRLSDLGGSQTEHVTAFQIRIMNMGTGTAEDQDDMIGYVGEVVDAIEASRTLGSSYVENTEIPLIDYSMQRQSESAILYHAFLTVEVRHIRNV